MLEVIMITLLSSCISSTKIKANIDYLRSLESEEIFSDNNGIYYKTIEPTEECSVDFERNLWQNNYSHFETNLEEQRRETTIKWLTERYCPKE